MDKTNLLVTAARLYYENEYSQNQIAEKLGISRPYVSKLLSQAKADGIVSITINDPNNFESAKSRALREKYGLKRVIIIPEGGEKAKTTAFGAAISRYLNSVLKSGDIISTSWGNSMYRCTKNLVKKTDLTDITVVQLCGGISNIGRNIYANEVLQNVSQAYDATPYSLPLPAVVDDARVKKVVCNDKSIKNVLDMAEKSRVALITMGRFGHDNALESAGYITYDQVEDLKVHGAVGDIWSHIITSDGEICDPDLDSRTVGIPLKKMLEKPHRVGVAMDRGRAQCTLGAIRGGYINVLIADEAVADFLLNEEK